MHISKTIGVYLLFTFAASAFAQEENTLFSLNSKPTAQPDSSIFIQIFKQEGVLELYQKTAVGKYKLVKTYPICKFSGGLGPKKIEGDLKSPEGFYQITRSQLNPNSRYYRSINL